MPTLAAPSVFADAHDDERARRNDLDTSFEPPIEVKHDVDRERHFIWLNLVGIVRRSDPQTRILAPLAMG